MASRSRDNIPQIAEITVQACLDWLRNNREKWFKAKDFEYVFNIDPRATRVVISKLRQRGHPIVSGNNGYCYTYNITLIQECASRLRSQIRETQIALDSILAAASTIPRQQANTPNGKLITLSVLHRDRNKGQRNQ